MESGENVMENIIIRRIETRDDEAVAKVIRTCLKEFGGDKRPGTAWSDPGLDHFSAIYTGGDNGYWVAENEKGEIVAGVGIGPLKGEDEVCELQKMYCLKPYRGTGIAQRLLHTALSEGRKLYKRCYLETMENMLEAQRFYEKHGFVKTCETLGSTGHDTGCPCHYICDLS